MVKKVIKKTVTQTVREENSPEISKTKPRSRKKTVTTTTSTSKKMTAAEREQLLIENFVGIQHAMTNLSIKFGGLSENISRLLQVYEEAAKSYAMNGKTDNEDMLNKINSLLDQNKTIAKGLVMMEAKIRSGSENIGSENVSELRPIAQPPIVQQRYSPPMQSTNYSPQAMNQQKIGYPNSNVSEKNNMGEEGSNFKVRPKPLPSI